MNKVKIMAGALLVSGTLVVAPNVAASAAFNQCPSNRLCLWGNNNFQWLIHTKAPNQGRTVLGGDANNQMDSWGNRTTRASRGYDTQNGTGDCQNFAAGSRDSNVAPFNSDEVSSTYTNGIC